MGIDMYTSAPVFPRHKMWLDRLDAEHQAEWADHNAGNEPPKSDTWERYQADEEAWETEHGVYSRRLNDFVGDLLEAAGIDVNKAVDRGFIAVKDLRAAAATVTRPQFDFVMVNGLGERFNVMAEAAKRLNDLAHTCERYGDAGVRVC